MKSNINLIKSVILLFSVLLITNASGQADSVWSVLILKKGKTPELKNNMAEFSNTGFYLYKNCFYDIAVFNQKVKTYKLIDVKKDTLIFQTVSSKTDNPNIVGSSDTLAIQYKSIKALYLAKIGTSKGRKKIDCSDFYFIFSKTADEFLLQSKFEAIFSEQNDKTELVPRFTTKGISYFYEYKNKLYYHSVVEIQPTKYTNEQKEKVLKSVLTALDIIINKRVTITTTREN